MPHPRIRVDVVDERLTALVHIGLGDPAGPAELRSALAESGVVHGIDESVCSRLGEALGNPEFQVTAEVVARGTPSENGEDGYLELAFEPDLQAGRLREDGSIDLRERGFLKSVSAGDRLAVRHPRTEGTSGCYVDGKVIPATPGAREPTCLGPGAVESEGAIRAAFGGVIHYQAGQLLDVVTHTVHTGDVDLRSGNLEMNGSLTVEGTVCRGMSVRAEVDLEVKGGIDGGSVSAGGSARIGGAVIGGANGGVVADGSVVVRHAQGACLRAGESLLVEAHALNCELRAREVLVRGRVLGGTVHAAGLIEVQEAGSPAGAGTVLRLDPPRESVATARVRVLGDCHPGVSICFGPHRLYLDQPGRSLSFRFDRESDGILVEGLNGAGG